MTKAGSRSFSDTEPGAVSGKRMVQEGRGPLGPRRFIGGWNAVFLVAVFFFFVLPFLRLALLSLWVDGRLSPGLYAELLASARVRSGILNTVGIVGVSTLLASALGLLQAWLIAHTDIRGKRLLEGLFVMPFVIPSYITSLAWARFTGPGGFLAQITGWNVPSAYSWWGIVAVMGICHAPLAFLFCLNALRKVPREAEWAARCSGAGPWRTFWAATVPCALPGIVGGAMTVVLAGLDNFGIPAFLGARRNINVLSTLIYQEVVGFGPSAFGRAAALSVVLGGIALLSCAVLWRLLRGGGVLESVTADRQPRCELGRLRPWVEGALWGFVAVTSLLPLLSMLAASLLKAWGLPLEAANLSLQNFAFLLGSPKALGALGNSFRLALFTGGSALVIGSYVAWGRVRRPGLTFRFAEAAFSLPFVLPGTVFALAMILAWMEPLPGWRPGIYGTGTLLAIAYVVRFSVLQLRASASALQQVDRSVEEAAWVCGAGRWACWRRVIVPLISSGLLAGFFMTTAHALTELTVSSVLGALGAETVGMVVLNFEQAGDVTLSCAFSVLVLGLLAILLLAGLALRRWVNRYERQGDAL